jgi:Tn3 transposase DDE domain-containing protein
VFEKSRFCHISPTIFPHSSFQTAGANPGPRTVSLDLPGLFKHPLNKGEARNALARAIFFYRLGEIRDRSFESQVYRASGLNLLIAVIILWNTRYLEHVCSTRTTGRQSRAYDCHARRAAWLGAYRSNGRLCLERRRAAAQGCLSTAQATRINARSLNVPFILIQRTGQF